MGKHKLSPGGVVNSTAIKSHDGGACEGGKFSVFEFDDDDRRVETESRKSLAKFKTKSPNKKPAHNRQSVDKYVFLQCFARGTRTKQNDSGKHMPVVDVTDSVFENRTVGTGAMISPGSSCYDYESHASSFLKNQGFGCSSCGAKSRAQRGNNGGGYTTGKKNIKALYVDSDEDESLELRPSTCYFDLAENEGSLEQLSDYGTKNNDCEAVVIVAPSYAKYGNRYYTSCILTFSQRCIRLEGSSLCERTRPFCIEWSSSDILKIEHRQRESVKADVVNVHLVSKGKNVVETGIGSSDNVELEFVILDDPQCFEKQEEIKSLDVKYKAAWTTITNECCFNKSFEDIVYPDGDPDAVFISTRDIELLQPRTFINDTIIDFYIKYLLNKTKPEEQHRFHFFNTFFFRKLADMDRYLSRGCEGRDAFQHVHKWTRNVDLFEKDYVFIPVNSSLHWSLIVICHLREVANIRDNRTYGSSKVPCILHMDSIRGSHRGFENLIRRYLWEEWKVRKHKHEEDSENFLNLDFIALKLPQQENLFDCGIFLLHYAELFLEQVSKFNTTKYLDILSEDWFHPAEVSLKKRDHIRKLIHKIVEDNALKDSSTARISKHLGSEINEGDNCPQFLQENSVNGSCHDIKVNSSEDYKIMGHKSFADALGQDKQLVPINQFGNMRLPMEEGIKKQATFLPGDTIDSHRTDDNDEPMPSRNCPVSIFKGGETMSLQVTSKISSNESQMIIDLQNEEDCIPEVAFATEREKERYENSSTSSEDLSTYVVEDSEEEECRTGTIRKTRRSSFLLSPVGLIT